MDEFAKIAASGIGGRMELLEEPQPIKYNAPIYHMKPADRAPISVDKKMSTREELAKELDAKRREYAPFLRNLAPEMGSCRERIDVENFTCDGKPISIPEYGGPVGKCKKVYTASFDMPETGESERAYICFGGADYRAAVMVNNEFAGEHTGFFSPFEFDITDCISKGKNHIKIVLHNDHIFMGNNTVGKSGVEGDKLYAATGLGWDDAAEGWHHCPAGMGIYADVYVEIRNEVHISDLYIRPLERSAEVWAEIENATYNETDNIDFSVSLYGQNFNERVFEDMKVIPQTVLTVGMGDSLTEAEVKPGLGKACSMPLKHGKNVYKFLIDIENPKVWELAKPYLYQLQLCVNIEGVKRDGVFQQFGMRRFEQRDYNGLHGMFFLNDEPIRLRGANTMGFEQQDVMNKDFDRLVDDILLAKICNMNFLRLTQRPVQKEVYDYCDRLGLMTQTDLPLFGCMRRSLVCEGIRQAEEMERIVRNHPCNVVISYINEPQPNAHNSPHRHLERHELEHFFECCDAVVRLQNPDRVIKHVDGDYDPPTEGMPDNHCYPMWYNGHGIDIGKLHKGYWLPVKPDWYYGCGEFGAEGLDFADLMQRRYPKEWLAEPFHPSNIVRAQTGDFHYFFYDTPEGIDEWVSESQRHQAFATKIMMEAFRRDDRMISNAIHLFIDAWPSGWMKTIMDCERNPKQAYFAYRDALEPVMLSLRTDRFTYTAGEEAKIEVFLCNDTSVSEKYKVACELYNGNGEMVGFTELDAKSQRCGSRCVGIVKINTCSGKDRESFTLRTILINSLGEAVTYAEEGFTVFAEATVPENENVVLIEKLPVGEHIVAGEKVVVKPCGMMPLHFVSSKTGHSAVAEFEKRDFSYWYDEAQDMITPILETTFTANGFTPVLISGNTEDNGRWSTALAVAEKLYEGKRYVICQLDLRCENPVAKRFMRNILGIE